MIQRAEILEELIDIAGDGYWIPRIHAIHTIGGRLGLSFETVRPNVTRQANRRKASRLGKNSGGATSSQGRQATILIGKAFSDFAHEGFLERNNVSNGYDAKNGIRLSNKERAYGYLRFLCYLREVHNLFDFMAGYAG